VGASALAANTTGSTNTGIGYQAGKALTTGGDNTAIGQALVTATTGGSNIAVGNGSLYSTTTAGNNVAVGVGAAFSNTTGQYNIAVGTSALSANTTASNNTAVCYQSLRENTTGGNNAAFGYWANVLNTTGSNNTAIGLAALFANTTASNNTAVGYQALYTLTTGNGQNTAVGNSAGYSTQGGAENNNYFGNSAGSTVTTGNGNVCLGHYAGTNTHTVFHITTQSDRVVVGNSLTTNAYVQVAWTVTSDARDKADVIPSTYGLDFVNKLKPVTFKWDKREWYTDGNRDGSNKDTITQTGFIAQELKALQEAENATYLNLVYESNPDKLEATPGNLLVPLIKAVQQLSVIVKQHQIEIDDLKSKVNK
jgi:hypothetical protein